MSDRISTSLFFQRSVNSLLSQELKLSELQTKVAAGKRIVSPSDDPVGTARLLNLKQQLFENTQYQENIGNAEYQLSSIEVQETNALNQVRGLRDLAIQAGTGTLSNADKQSISLELKQALEQLLDIANANHNGEYIFSGAKSLTRPVVKDENGRYLYSGDESKRYADIGPSVSIAISDTAKALFFGFETNDINTSGYAGQTGVISANPGLVASATLTGINTNELSINDIKIVASADDGLSTTDASASAVAIAAAINDTTSKHGVIAAANSNTFDFTGGTYSTGALVANDLTINGVQIIGNPAIADAHGLADLITAANVPGITASDNAGQLQLTATDGRNIQLETTGATGSGINFGNFSLTAGPLDQVQRGRVSLTDHKAITIAGSNPNNAGFTTGIYNVTGNAGTGVLSTPEIVAARPIGSSRDENYLIRFIGANTFNIYKESDPTTAITGVKKFSIDQTYKDAEEIDEDPITYNAGDTFIVEGVQFSITGVPVANDTFTIDLESPPTQNLFNAIENLTTALHDYGDNPTRLSYEIGLALSNFSSAESLLIENRSKVGATLTLADNQQKSNEEFISFTKQGMSAIEDLDITSAISELVRQQMSFEAAQRSLVMIQRLSLFDYL